MRARAAIGMIASAGLLLSACSSVPKGGGYYLDDGPQDRAIDISQIPDAVPRKEPLSASGNKPYTVFGVNYTPLTEASGYRERGVASWYGKKFHGKRTSSGEPYDMYAMTAAHKTLPLPCYARVTNLETGKSVVVRVNDRGPFLHNRLIDLSYSAAARLGVIGRGTAIVELEVIGPETPATPVITAKPNLSVIAPAQATDTPARAKSAAPTLTVQVGAFQQYENAASLRDRLERAGLGPIRIEPANDTVSANRLYRVRISPIESVEQGDRLVNEAARLGIRDALIIVD